MFALLPLHLHAYICTSKCFSPSTGHHADRSQCTCLVLTRILRCCAGSCSVLRPICLRFHRLLLRKPLWKLQTRLELLFTTVTCIQIYYVKKLMHVRSISILPQLVLWRRWWWFVVACSRVSWRDFNLQDTLSFMAALCMPHTRCCHISSIIVEKQISTRPKLRSTTTKKTTLRQPMNYRLMHSSRYWGRGPEKVFGFNY